MGAQPVMAKAKMMQYLDGKEVSDAEYYAEMDLRSMIETEKIKNDPKRLKACMARKKKLAMALESIMGKGMGYSGGSHKKKKKMSYGSSHAAY